jgi:hypothetical protein
MNRKLFGGKESDSITNPYEIKAKPTEYKSFTYKSKLEAQHAKFFDLLGIDFRYEPERFYFIDEVYLPDFKLWMPPNDTIRWVEVKGPMYGKARMKAILLCREVRGLVQIWAGGWGSQVIYNFEWITDTVKISKSKQFDVAFRHWSKKELREAYEQSRNV